MSNNNYMQLENEVLAVIKTIYDPEIPVNIFDLGLIYEIDTDEENNVDIKMTLTAPNCPMVDDMLAEIHEKVGAIALVNKVNVDIVWDPPWDKSMLTEEAKLELGLL